MIGLFILLFFTGCNNQTKSTDNIDFLMTYNEIDIKPGTFFSNVFVNLGEYNNKRVEPSSYYEGEASIYEYDNFEIETYVDKDIEKIYSVIITNEEQGTNEGIKIGDSVKKMVQIYGKNYLKPIDNIYVYTVNNTNITFTIENDIIIGIMYHLV